MTPGERFPTYAAEERRRGALPAGVEQVPLSGTPAPALPPHVVDAVAATLSRRMKTPPVQGLAALRAALAGELERTTERRVDPETEILVTNGAMQALGVCFRSLLEPGDEVVVPTPCFFFGGPISTAGGVPVYVPGVEADGWRWDVAAIEQAIGPRTKALLLCNPGNPTGYAPSREDVAAVVALAERHGLVIVTDEAYEASLWDDAPFTSAFGIGADVIVIRSLGKSLSMPQLRLGLLAGPAERVTGCMRTLEWDCLRVNVASQEAARAALEGPRGWLEQIHAATAADRAVAVAAVAATPGLTGRDAVRGPVSLRRLVSERGSRSSSRPSGSLSSTGPPSRAGAMHDFRSEVPSSASILLHDALHRWAQLHAR